MTQKFALEFDNINGVEYVKAIRPNGDTYKVPTHIMYNESPLVDMINAMAEDLSNFTIENCIKNAQKQSNTKLTTENKGIDMTKAHKHKDLIIAWANGETIQLWNEKRYSWVDIFEPNFNSDAKFRVKPKTIKIGDVEVIAPITKVPKNGQLLYAATLAESGYSSFPWDGMEVDVDAYYFSNNLLFDNKEDAKSFSFALRKLIQKAVDTSRSH